MTKDRWNRWPWIREEAVVSGEVEERNAWSVVMKEKQRMKRNKNKGNALQILQIKTRSVYGSLGREGSIHKHAGSLHCLIRPRGIITWCRWADNALHAILYEVHMSRHADVRVCVWRRETKRRFRRQERTPLGNLLPSLSKSDVRFFKQEPKTSNRLLNSIFTVFQGCYYAPPQCRFKTWRIPLLGSFQDSTVQKTSNFFRHNEGNGPSGSLTMPEWEFYKTGRLQTEISTVLFPVTVSGS